MLLEYKQLIYVGFARSAPSTNSVVKIRGNESLINFQKRAKGNCVSQSS